MAKSLLAYRNFSGVGDWIMAMTVLKMVNIQYPDIDIYLNLKASNLHLGTGPGNLPTIINEIVIDFDVSIKDHTYYDNPKEYANKYDYNSGHMVYERGNKHFISSMVEQFNKNSGLNLKYDDKVFAQYKEERQEELYAPATPYVLVQACTKRKEANKKGKDFGHINMQIITNKLKGFINVIQIGTKEDFLLRGAFGFCMSLPLQELHNLMKSSTCFIGMNGALGIYAAHHSVKQFIICNGEYNPKWTEFPNRIQLDGNKMKAEVMAETIIMDIDE